ncbi:DUF3995 domain-containing protein [Paenibacillus sp. DMB20]|uniref:DUF3995 domain-containing protein n=1 Tax=Paenibacillus sp. DMB20 TaxID=1642570 RepID=UPI000627A3DD|nr:DUF3995 domain-containing protein [Paenibacillus sp. DMB20]KKO52686.1 membrane protein [Paenibacillus sp. DMB20]
MVTAIPVLAACILFAVGLLHIYWAFGGIWGMGYVLPEQDGRKVLSPGVGMTLLVAILVIAAGIVLLLQARIIELTRPYLLVRIGAWVCACVFALRVVGEFNHFGLFKKKRDTAFSRMDTLLYMPLCAFLSLAFIIALSYEG